MNKKSELDCYLYFMWNEWSLEIAVEIFGESLGNHLWGKWDNMCWNCDFDGAPAKFYSNLDSDNRRVLVEYAISYYNRA